MIHRHVNVASAAHANAALRAAASKARLYTASSGAVFIGAYRFRQGKENNVCKDVWVGTVKIPKKINANDDVENFEDYALAA